MKHLLRHLILGLALAATTVITTVAAQTNAADIASLKQYWVAAPGSTLYTLASNPLVSWIEPVADGTRLYIQDTGGAIALHLPTPTATLPIRVGDELGSLSGTLGLSSGVLTLFCAAPPAVVSSGNPIDAEPVDLLSLTLSPTRYESMLIQADNVSLQGGGGTIFQPNRRYTIAHQSATGTIATIFPRANYLGTVIPTAPFNLTALADYNRLTGDVALTPRTTSDISYSTGNLTTGSWTADDIFAADGYLHIRSLTRQPLEVYSLLGQVVVNRWVDPGLTEIQMPAGGVYIVRLGGLTKRIGIP